MTIIKKLVKDKTAKSKKTIISWIVGVVIALAVLMFFVSDGYAAFGVILSFAILVAVAVGTYFILRAMGELPDAFS